AEDRARSLPFPHGPFTLAYVKSYAVMTDVFAGDLDGASAGTHEIREIAERHGYLFWNVCANVHDAIIATRRGDAAGLPQLAMHVGIFRALGAEVLAPTFLTEQSYAHLVTGEYDAALATLRAAEALTERTGAGFVHAETIRLIGLARLSLGDENGVDDLWSAVRIAREQGARLFELRALTSLCANTAHARARQELSAL